MITASKSVPVKQFLIPGDLFIAKEFTLFKTVLGSCISVCLYDKRLKKGGMNHFIHSELKDREADYSFGDIATIHLIEDMLKSGSELKDLSATIVGGASSFSARNGEGAGQKNINVARRILKEWNIPIFKEQTGGCHGRTLVFNSESNETIVAELDDCLAMCKRVGGTCQNKI